MGWVLILAGKLAIGLLACAATWVVLRSPLFMRLAPRSFTAASFALLLINRVGLFLIVMVGLHFPAQSDVTVYFEQATRVLHGEIPFRDFFTAYSPLYPYVAALPLLVWNSAKAVMLESMAAEALALLLWLGFARSAFGEATARRATLIYCCNPLSQLVVPLAGQNHIWLSLFLAAALFITARRASAATEASSGIVFALGTMLVKWLALLYAPILFMRSRHRVVWAAAMVIPIVLLYAAWTYRFGPEVLLGNIRYHAHHASSGNLPYLLTAFGINLDEGGLEQITNLIGLAILAGFVLVPALYFRRFDDKVTTFLLVAISLLTLIVSKKAFASYFVIALFPFCLLIAERASLALLMAALGLLLLMGLEPSLWLRFMEHQGLGDAFLASQGARHEAALVFFLIEATLIGAYIAFAAFALRQAFATKHLPRQQPAGFVANV
jgi:hypothetical protein